MEINSELVKKMSALARVKLSETEVLRLEKEFNEIFEYFSSIKEIGGESEQLFYVTGAKGELRADKINAKEKDEIDAIIKNFAQKDGRLLIAPKSLD
ncbi:MAG: Asp-tRNA(Asn)/Glu-tRNA(Gln) amidotransferase subunit GatC [Candidatus Micrarchaeota archaeon]